MTFRQWTKTLTWKNPVQIVLFEDERVEQLAPLAAAEPVFAVTCGGYKLAQLVGNIGPEATLVRKHLAAVEAETFPARVPPQTPLTGPLLFVNARLVPSISVFGRLKTLAAAGNECVVSSGGSIAAALVNRDSIDLSTVAGASAESHSGSAPSPQPSPQGRGSPQWRVLPDSPCCG